MARPSKYDSDLHPIWAQSLAMEGLIDQEIADQMGVARSTLKKWENEHKEFSDALKMGKRPADAKVEQSLYKRAIGYSYTERKLITEIDEDGNHKPVKIETYERHAVPDTTAQIFWLKNRRPADWRDKQNVEFGKESDITINVSPASAYKKEDVAE